MSAEASPIRILVVDDLSFAKIPVARKINSLQQ
jgi:hypothetical protein